MMILGDSSSRKRPIIIKEYSIELMLCIQSLVDLIYAMIGRYTLQLLCNNEIRAYQITMLIVPGFLTSM